MLNYSMFLVLGNRSIITHWEHPTSVSSPNQLLTAGDRPVKFAPNVWFLSHRIQRKLGFHFDDLPLNVLWQDNVFNSFKHLSTVCCLKHVVFPPITDQRQWKESYSSRDFKLASDQKMNDFTFMFGTIYNKTLKIKMSWHEHQPLVSWS